MRFDLGKYTANPPDAVIEEIAQHISRDGYVAVENVISQDVVRAAAVEFEERRLQAEREGAPLEGLKLSGKGRYMISTEIDGALGDRALFAPPALLRIVRAVLGPAVILESFGVVLANGGATQQRLHRDSPLLFDHQIGAMVPAYALTVAIPLIPLELRNGPTRVAPGSHRWLASKDDAQTEFIELGLGSLMIWDFRTFHGGGANRSRRPRPLLFETFSQQWWRDHVNYDTYKAPRLTVSKAVLESLDEEDRTIFNHLSWT